MKDTEAQGLTHINTSAVSQRIKDITNHRVLLARDRMRSWDERDGPVPG
jgi:hypothetical protein